MLDSDLLREMGTIARSIQSMADGRFRDLGLSRGQFIFVTRICEQPGISQMDLTALLKVDKSTTAKAVRKLVEIGYASKEKDAKDRRLARLFPTTRAEKAYASILAEENRSIAVCLTEFSADERAAMERLLRRMRQNINGAWEEWKRGTAD